MRDKLSVLKEYFGHDSFREGQDRITDSLLGGRDVLGIMPTGAGKSICYQVPALMFDGITIVVSPLISLMKDQVSALVQSGVAAAYINSSLTHAQYLKVLQNTESGKYKIIYVAPERLCAPAFLGICRNLNIFMVAVDEAHCVSQWGQDFRPSYLKIPDFIDSLNSRPVVGAFTATATGAVRDDIKTLLRLVSPLVVTTGFDRPNLFFSVMQPKNKSIELMKLIKERKNESGIVYCSTRKAVEEVCELLQKNGFAATRYHAGLDENERRRNQDDFVYDRAAIIVATNAFGMGIDKSNVSFVIHYNMPKNMESYYQEAGRAGRDGRSADCILLYSAKDVRTNQFLINNSEPNPDLTEDEQEEVRRRDRERLKQMTFYCTTHKCLRKFILEYFGDKGPERCEKCSNCLSNHENTDITVDAQKIMSCVARTGQRYGKKSNLRCPAREQKRAADIRRAEQTIDLRHNGGLPRKAAARHHRPSLRKRIHDRTGQRIPDTQTRAEEPRSSDGSGDAAHDARDTTEKESCRRKRRSAPAGGRKAPRRAQGSAKKSRHAPEHTGLCRFHRRDTCRYVPPKAENAGGIYGGLRSRSGKITALRRSFPRSHCRIFGINLKSRSPDIR